MILLAEDTSPQGPVAEKNSESRMVQKSNWVSTSIQPGIVSNSEVAAVPLRI